MTESKLKLTPLKKNNKKNKNKNKFTIDGFRSMRKGAGDGVDDKPEGLNPQRTANARDRHHMQRPL